MFCHPVQNWLVSPLPDCKMSFFKNAYIPIGLAAVTSISGLLFSYDTIFAINNSKILTFLSQVGHYYSFIISFYLLTSYKPVLCTG